MSLTWVVYAGHLDNPTYVLRYLGLCVIIFEHPLLSIICLCFSSKGFCCLFFMEKIFHLTKRSLLSKTDTFVQRLLTRALVCSSKFPLLSYLHVQSLEQILAFSFYQSVVEEITRLCL